MLHVVFSPSAAGILRRVLRAMGLSEPVVALTDDMSWGPIPQPDGNNRQRWFEANVPSSDWERDSVSDRLDRFLAQTASDQKRLVWFAPRCCQEVAGLHWYLDAASEARTQFVLADKPMTTGAARTEAPLGLGILNEEAMAELFANAPRLPLDEQRFPPARWRELAHDEELLRLIYSGSLQSAPSDVFDKTILANLSPGWSSPVRAIGEAIGDAWELGHKISDDFLLWRIYELIRMGELAHEGELRGMREFRVRKVSGAK